MELPRTNDSQWRNSTVSDGLTMINEEGSIQSSEHHDAPVEKILSMRHPSYTRRPSDGTTEDVDAISAASSVREEHEAHEVFEDDRGTTSGSTVYSESKSLTRKDVNVYDHLSITIGPPVILLLDLVVPCAIYYSWLDVERKKWHRNGEVGPQPTYNKHIMGLSVISFGLGEIYILVVRIIRLIKDFEGCAPLLSKSRWELDATCWVYLMALLVALIPYMVSTNARPEVIPWLYIYPPGFLMAFIGVLGVISLLPIRLPFRINSTPAGTMIRPLIFYAAEDFLAVDGFQGRAFRKIYYARYAANATFRRMILLLTIYWIVGICVFNGLLAAIIWNLKFEHAFGTSLGVLFGFIATMGGTTFLWVRRVVEREKWTARQGKEERMDVVEDELPQEEKL